MAAAARAGAFWALATGASFAASGFVTTSKFLRLSLQSLALGLGAWLAIGNSISAGAVFAASFMAGRALQPIEQLLSSWRSIAQARSAYEKINDMLGARAAEIALTHVPPPEGRIDVEQISDRITFIDRGRLVESSDKEDFLERWRRIQLQLPPGADLPELPNLVSRVTDGQFVTLITDRFYEGLLAPVATHVRDVQRMSLEEIFVANVMRHREARGQ